MIFHHIRDIKEELRIWSKLNHKNVLHVKCLGYLYTQVNMRNHDGLLFTSQPPLALVSEWMENGTATSYLKSHPNTEVTSIVSLTRRFIGITC